MARNTQRQYYTTEQTRIASAARTLARLHVEHWNARDIDKTATNARVDGFIQGIAEFCTSQERAGILYRAQDLALEAFDR